MDLGKKLKLIILFLLLSIATYAQNADVSALIKEGIELNNAHNYTAAIEKYKQALTADPENIQANYQMAFSLVSSGKGTDGITYLNKVVKTSNNFTGPAYELLGSIYDATKQPQQAIDAYKAGIKIKPDYQPFYFNIGLAYFRAGKYADAELAAIEAIKLDPKHANSQRLYGLVTFHQNKRAPALLALCNFLLLEPDGPRSAEAYANMQSILKGGALKIEGKTDVENIALNKAIATAAATTDNRKYASPADLLAAQLKAIFIAIGELSEKQTGNDFFRNYYAGFFYKLAQTEHMPAFARLMDLSANKAADIQWLQQNEDKRKALEAWVAAAERKF
ncbi:Tetratricopeptide repeat-containing protein [Mucilaginibacter lappiensis]|uniref:Tetratricopeptide (TPR) repeat protein n=1 Tax=Mucilaginibacter lappiensis TaxID=354630 RepID=A0ABR6PF62_9SPHI|nr:tetratricopeptide repeat protein [Mucilaginibacter lappiensis]MBB6108407.1 tetratricopeptide (TPR) repeat protein [Mucilaginibacter lappiensis]SIQ38994.1 Tetratricopeptide repeat-containing protein [Mucilaginibacter lappiensis]